jgi:N-acetylmuramoyl-L-alanine amidase
MRPKFLLPLICAALSLGALLFAACTGPSSSPPPQWQSGMAAAGGPQVTPLQLLQQEIRLQPRLIPRGTHGRKYHRPMAPRYITIHSTQNYSGDAFAHATALRNGKLRATRRPGGNRIGYLTWHFTVQDNLALQHLPTTEQGEHADFDGPGNNHSIGIEMCEHRGNNLSATIDRTAKLAAYLMYEHNIPLRNVVPHYHWPRRGQSPPNKNCPHFLLDNGRPGRKWAWFLGRVQAHHRRLIAGPCPRI